MSKCYLGKSCIGKVLKHKILLGSSVPGELPLVQPGCRHGGYPHPVPYEEYDVLGLPHVVHGVLKPRDRLLAQLVPVNV